MCGHCPASYNRNYWKDKERQIEQDLKRKRERKEPRERIKEEVRQEMKCTYDGDSITDREDIPELRGSAISPVYQERLRKANSSPKEYFLDGAELPEESKDKHKCGCIDSVYVEQRYTCNWHRTLGK